ncbi:MAG: MBL fold metallo-hydrolase [Pyrinomonadaceae bacterium]|nr:MBL fold metallo-hydrolase [Pyrinomonadaceae bacterium]
MAKVSFYGGVGTVTGSKYLIEHNGKKVLVDCGLFQGLREIRERNWAKQPFDPKELDAVIITHAHIDHTGFLPRVVRLGFNGPVFTSRATGDLMKILLPDSARIQEEDARYRNRKGLSKHKPALPLYESEDADAALQLLQQIPNDGNPVDICEGIKASFNVAGHILGASLVLVELENARPNGDSIKFLFSGDLGHYDQPILKDPAPPPACDYLMVESTYGDRLHSDQKSDDQMTKIIHDVVKRNAPLLIPAFAVGRTQEILYLIRELEEQGRIPVLPVVVDSPMGKQATQVYNRWNEEHDEEYASILATQRHPLKTKSMTTTNNRNDSIKLNKLNDARIIISSSGMLSGGRVIHHARRLLPNPDATIVFVGYQATGTKGRYILNGDDEVRLMREWIPVKCHVERIDGFSAHADWKSVLKWLKGLTEAPKAVFTTHGEPESAAAMAQHIRDEFGWNVVEPKYKQTVELT